MNLTEEMSEFKHVKRMSEKYVTRRAYEADVEGRRDRDRFALCDWLGSELSASNWWSLTLRTAKYRSFGRKQWERSLNTEMAL